MRSIRKRAALKGQGGSYFLSRARGAGCGVRGARFEVRGTGCEVRGSRYGVRVSCPDIG